MLISLLVAVIVFALILWLIGFLPLPDSPFPIKTVLYVVVVVAAIIYLLRYLR